MADKRPALGKGLSALIPDAAETRRSTVDVDIDLLTPNRMQPRTQMDEAKLARLAESIRQNGLIQPIVVQRAGAGFQIVAGERRWRAAQLAGQHRVPVVIREGPADDGRLLELALIENIQRENLNPIEEAKAYRLLLDDFHLTQERVAAAVGKDRASVANYLRLLKLPSAVQLEVAAGRLSMGHARALLGLDEAAAGRAARDVIARGLSVRATEALVARLARAQAPARKPARQADVHTRAAEDRLSVALGTRARIVRKRRGGTIEITFVNEDELQRLYEKLTGEG